MRPNHLWLLSLLGVVIADSPSQKDQNDKCEATWRKAKPDTLTPLPMGEGQVEWDEDVNVKRGYDLYGRSLEKRAGKARNFKFCDDQGQAADNFLMVYNSPAYPNGNDALCYDAENWATDAVYKLKVGKTPAKDPKSKHSYIDEHILELQTLKWFLHSYMNDKAGGLDEFKWKPKEFDTDPATKQKRSYCEYFHKYWDEPLGAKPKGKKKTTAFDFVATAFPSKTAHGYVGRPLRKTDRGPQAYPVLFRDELVMLENNTNAVKAQVCHPHPTHAGNEDF